MKRVTEFSVRGESPQSSIRPGVDGMGEPDRRRHPRTLGSLTQAPHHRLLRGADRIGYACGPMTWDSPGTFATLRHFANRKLGEEPLCATSMPWP